MEGEERLGRREDSVQAGRGINIVRKEEEEKVMMRLKLIRGRSSR